MENNHRLMQYVTADKIHQDLLNMMTNQEAVWAKR